MLSYLLRLSLLSISYADETEEPIETTVDTNAEEETEDDETSVETASGEVSTPTESTEQNDEEQSPEDSTNSETSTPTDAELDQEAIESLMNAIMQESAQLEDEESNDNDEEEYEDDDDFNLKGNFDYSYVMTLWKDVGVFHAAQLSVDPQYFFRNDKGNGFTLGVRYQVNGTGSINHHTGSIHSINSSLLGLTTGYQLGALRFNTAASWTLNHYFTETETDRTEDFITYQYTEIPAMSGVLWENTLTYAPEDSEFGIQLGAGFPFQINGEREMGEAFTGSWQASSLLSIGFGQIGYTYIVYPDHVIERIQMGLGIIF